jgi:hypothetical protein
MTSSELEHAIPFDNARDVNAPGVSGIGRLRIRGIAPADPGWRMVVADRNGADWDFSTKAVVCWGITTRIDVDGTQDEFVEALVDIGGGAIEPHGDCQNVIGFLPPGAALDPQYYRELLSARPPTVKAIP